MRSLVLILFIFGWPARSMANLVSAQQAGLKLGRKTWSRVLRIENLRPGSEYPSTVYALVFEFAGILWFYTDADGTQSLSLHVNRVEQEKADLGPLLRAIDAGFVIFSVVPDLEETFPSLPLPNGCFIDSVVALRERAARGEPIKRAELVMYFAAYRAGGHCILAYETPKGVFLLDPLHDPRPRRFGRNWPDKPIRLAAASWPEGRLEQISKVRVLPLTLSPAPDQNHEPLASAEQGGTPRRPSSPT